MVGEEGVTTEMDEVERGVAYHNTITLMVSHLNHASDVCLKLLLFCR